MGKDFNELMAVEIKKSGNEMYDYIVKKYNEGQSIGYIADDIYFKNKSLKEKITKKEAHGVAERIICDYILNKKDDANGHSK